CNKAAWDAPCPKRFYVRLALTGEPSGKNERSSVLGLLLMQQPSDRLLEVFRRDGLFEVSVATNGKRRFLFLFTRVGRVVDDRHTGLQGLQLLAQLDAGPIRQSHIEDKEVESKFSRELQTLGNRTGSRDEVSKVLQRRRDQEAQ